MTREEAREILTHNWTRVDNPNYSESELDEAFFMAIEALSANTVSREQYDCVCDEYNRLVHNAICIKLCDENCEYEKGKTCYHAREHYAVDSVSPANYTTKKPNDIVEQGNDVVAEPTDLISRADAIEAVEDGMCTFYDCDVLDRINAVPSADRPSGEWIIRENGNKECSLCGHERQDGWDYFCGYCGAKMGSGGLYYADDRPTGEWVYKEADPNLKGDWYCDHCGVRAEVDLYGEWILSDYCPNCGAKMGSGTR